MPPINRRTLGVAAAGTLVGTLALHGASAASRSGEGAARAADDAPRAGGRTAAPGELRGMWIATVDRIDWPAADSDADRARADLLALLDEAVRLRLNTIFLQVRPSADALWPSPFEPWSQWLTGTQGRDPGWNPLEFAVGEAHDRGLALHAWCNPYRVALHDDPSRLASDHPVRRNPDWAIAHGGRLYYDPGLPEVRRFAADAMLHAVETHDVDGLHWDDYFYPYPVPGEEFADDVSFARHGGGASRADWRRNNIDLLVRETAERIRASRPDALFGVSPFGVWRNRSTDPEGSATSALQTYDDLYADTRRWVREGWLDYVLPQLYWHIGHAPADYAELVRWWARTVEGTGVALWIGEAVYKVGDPQQPEPWRDPAELSRHLDFCRDHPAVGGHAYFSASRVVADPLGAMELLATEHHREPVDPPRADPSARR
ncbi:glycoside hydrolase family 10 protein [Streptomyces alkaliphilus]|uniref:glycoside hydrolase family 10 protein n=1 Tax=Streptomyces alkaliphilus TaxID=1472722 RepID=UPI00117F73A2|nr:family 10 glycosylhydrolase [Streptomyces alkaliphilus]MQS07037.1 family 10 glycosylhydrolase [Streptomyces alkaliphilus]